MEKPDSGTWEWDGDFAHDASVVYTCGPYGNFLLDNGTKLDEIVSSCAWNKSWVPDQLPACVAKACQVKILTREYQGLLQKF